MTHPITIDAARLPRDWTDFETQRDHDRRELTERFANQRQTRTGAINELAALLDAEGEQGRLAAEAIETALTGGCRECHQVNDHHKLDCGKRF